MKKIVLILLIALLSILCFAGVCFLRNAAKNNLSISNNDIEPYLREIFSDDLFFTLLGEKPISFVECYSLKFSSRTKRHMLTFLETKFHNSPKFILKIFELQPRLYNIILVHKKALETVVLEDPLLCEFVRRKFHDIHGLYCDLEDSKKNIFSTFDSDPILLGIVLGYGRNNSEFFSRRCKLGQQLGKLSRHPLSRFASQPTLFSFCTARGAYIQAYLSRQCCHSDIMPKVHTSKFQSLEDEWAWIEENYMPIHYDIPPILFKTPTFIACKGAESERLIQRFALAADKIAILFEEKELTVFLAEEAQKM